MCRWQITGDEERAKQFNVPRSTYKYVLKLDTIQSYVKMLNFADTSHAPDVPSNMTLD